MNSHRAEKVLVIGGSGNIGGAIARAFAKNGHAVSATCSSTNSASGLEQSGLTPIIGDISRPGDWVDEAARSQVVVYAAQERAAKRLNNAWLERSRRTRDASFDLLLDALGSSGTCRSFLHTSAISVLGDQGDATVDENTLRKPSPVGDFHHEGETRVLEVARKGVPASVIRPGFVYGPGGTFAEFFIKEARKGFYPFPGNGRNYLPWVHIDDLAQAYVLAASKTPVGKIVHIVDDEPIRLRDFGKLLVAEAGGGRAMGMPKVLVSVLAGGPLVAMLAGSYRPGNRRARDLLGWQPAYPTVCHGLADTFDAFDRLKAFK